jgi:hypothetical protein
MSGAAADPAVFQGCYMADSAERFGYSDDDSHRWHMQQAILFLFEIDGSD